jgi:hypothetical protein
MTTLVRTIRVAAFVAVVARAPVASAQGTKPGVVILATGGTIAGVAPSAPTARSTCSPRWASPSTSGPGVEGAGRHERLDSWRPLADQDQHHGDSDLHVAIARSGRRAAPSRTDVFSVSYAIAAGAHQIVGSGASGMPEARTATGVPDRAV